MEDFITKELLEELGFTRKSYTESAEKGIFYGVAESISPKGMTVIDWSTRGHRCTYFGKGLDPNISVGIKKDGGTRTAFNGYVFSVEEFKLILKLTW